MKLRFDRLFKLILTFIIISLRNSEDVSSEVSSNSKKSAWKKVNVISNVLKVGKKSKN